MRLHWTNDTDGVGNIYGYSSMNKQLRAAIESAGIEFDRTAEVAFHVATPSVFRPIPERYNVLFTMYEMMEIPPDWAYRINQADLVIVPCEHNKRLFGRYYYGPIVVAPLGVDRKMYPYIERIYPHDRPFVFLWVGASNPRKGYEHVVAAWKVWNEKFPDEAKRSQLILKTTQLEAGLRQTRAVTKPDGTVVFDKGAKQEMPAERLLQIGANAVFDSRRLPMERTAELPSLCDLYHHAHAFLFPTMGEGFGLTLAEAMSTGLPSIYTPYSGPVDFISDREGYPVKWKYDRVQSMEILPDGSKREHFSAQAASADVHSIVRKMYRVMTQYEDEGIQKGRRAAERIAAYTWERCADVCLSAIRTMTKTNPKPKPQTLNCYEYRVYSQNGEDGIIAEIFERIEPKYQEFCEIGIGDPREGKEKQGKENNTLFLTSSGWSGVWIDAVRPPEIPASVDFTEGFVTKDNADFLVPDEIDLLSIDIDGNDFWIWKQITARPAVVIMEYNARTPPEYVMPYDEAHTWDHRSMWTGAGIDALRDLGQEKGYTLIATDSMGVNAFFVLDEYADLFPEDVRVHEYGH